MPAAPAPEERGALLDALFPEPTAGMVLHRVLAMAARTFLLNEQATASRSRPARTGRPRASMRRSAPVPSGPSPPPDPSRGPSGGRPAVERIHQSRVAMRRIRSNLRTFRLLLDPGWGTSLRAELAWYGKQLGRTRDLDILAAVITAPGTRSSTADDVARLLAVVETQRRVTLEQMATLRNGPRRDRLTEQIMVLWDGPEFKPKAKRPAEEVLPPMLQRAWRDLRGTARTARKCLRNQSPRAPHPAQGHALRLRDGRPGRGRPGPKTARAAEQLQSKLGDLHDAVYSLDWLEALAHARGDLASPIVSSSSRSVPPPRRPDVAGSASSRRSNAAGAGGRTGRRLLRPVDVRRPGPPVG